jgi:hypothetical protein
VREADFVRKVSDLAVATLAKNRAFEMEPQLTLQSAGRNFVFLFDRICGSDTMVFSQSLLR